MDLGFEMAFCGAGIIAVVAVLVFAFYGFAAIWSAIDTKKSDSRESKPPRKY